MTPKPGALPGALLAKIKPARKPRRFAFAQSEHRILNRAYAKMKVSRDAPWRPAPPAGDPSDRAARAHPGAAAKPSNPLRHLPLWHFWQRRRRRQDSFRRPLPHPFADADFDLHWKPAA